MSKLLANQIANYNDNGPVEAKEGLNFPTDKPLQVNGSPGSSGQFLRSDGTGVVWQTVSIPAAQVNADWNSSSGVSQILNKPTISAVGQSGDYTDLINKPTIPPAQVNADWTATAGVARILNKPTLFSGNYADLIGKPSIPSTITDLSDVDLPGQIVDGTYIQWNATAARWQASTGAAGINDIVEDVTPQLGGNLDAQGYNLSGLGELNFTGQRSKIRFHYNTINELPNAANYHGMFAHVHATGGAYFAHGGTWIELAKITDIPADIDTTYSQDAVADPTGARLRLTSSSGVQDDILVSAGSNITIDNVTSSGFRINSLGGGGGGGATVTTDDNAPSNAVDGDLWWKSDEGRLKVYYADGDSNQWIDASPPLAPTNISNNGSTVGVGSTTGPFGTNPNSIILTPDGTNPIKLNGRVEMGGHIIPSTNADYDLGNAEYKIRHLFLSDNSMWLGDKTKVGIDSNGKFQIQKRKSRDTFVPKTVRNLLITAGLISNDSQASAHALNWFNVNVYASSNISDLADITLSEWYLYAQSIPGFSLVTYPTADSLFPKYGDALYDTEDYEEIIHIAQSGFAVAPVETNVDQVAIDLKAGYSSYVLDDPSADFSLILSECDFKPGSVVEFSLYVKQGATARTVSSMGFKAFDGSVIAPQNIHTVGALRNGELQRFNVGAVFLGGSWTATVQIV